MATSPAKSCLNVRTVGAVSACFRSSWQRPEGADPARSDAGFHPTTRFNRSAWDIGKPGSVTYLINEMHKKKRGVDLDDTVGCAM